MTKDRAPGSPASEFSLRSMTGFARAVASVERVEVEVELKSVNHRFFEVSCKLPRVYAGYERRIRGVLQEHHRRGRIDVNIVRRELRSPEVSEGRDLSALETGIDSYVRVFTRACARYGVSGDHLGNFLAQVVLQEARGRDERGSEESVYDDVLEEGIVVEAVRRAGVLLLSMREEEGRALGSDIVGRLRSVEMYRDVITQAAKDLSSKARARLTERLATIAPEVSIDPQRVAAEVALMAERCDVSEELIRLESHFQQFRGALGGDVDGVGRKLDFLLQEIGREFNTISSKAQDARIQGVVVDAKAELEKIREQVQNIE